MQGYTICMSSYLRVCHFQGFFLSDSISNPTYDKTDKSGMIPCLISVNLVFLSYLRVE